MKQILKPVFEIITEEYVLFDNVIYNYIILSIIGVIALKVAWNFVGKLYDYGIIIGKSSGSIIHWIIRLMIFTVLFYILGGIIWLTKLVYLYKTESIIILASSVIILILYKLIQKVYTNNKRYAIKNEVENEEK
ncbi:MAG TPA: hypothetical protein OIM50_05595 [Clostridiaceae bacterium]|nr:hypothetical protein [Clostridiaceae bacterium]